MSKDKGEPEMTTYKIIKRKYYETMDATETKVGLFIARGMWADGHLAYSLIDENGNALDEECMFVQIRENNQLVMVRI